MGLFFTEQAQFKKATRRETMHTQSLEMIHQLECSACPLNSIPVQSPQMEPVGSDTPLVYFLGQSPSGRDDALGKPFSGPPGQLLKRRIPGKYKSEVRYNNVVRTKTPDSRKPVWKEVESCRPSVLRDIEETKPVIVVTLGKAALDWALPGESSLQAWRGRFAVAKFGTHVCWVAPTYHPGTVLAEADIAERGVLDTIKGEAFAADITAVFNRAETVPWPELDDVTDMLAKPDCDKLLGFELITGEHGDKDLTLLETRLQKLGKEEYVALDIETDNLKPYREGAKILTNSVTGSGGTVAYALDHPENKWTPKQLQKAYSLTKQFLVNAPATKVAHTLPFELIWFIRVYGREIARASNWGCTQAQAYAIDERAGALSLDALCLQYFGVHLKGMSRLDRSNLEHEVLIKVLRYNALDTLYTHKLYPVQSEILHKQKRYDVYVNNQLRRIPTIALAMDKGVLVDQEQALANQKRAEGVVAEEYKRIQEHPVVKEMVTAQGKPLNPDSPPQVAVLFRDYLKRPEGWQDDGKYSVKAEVLESIKHPVAIQILGYRGSRTLKGTFIDPIVSGEHCLADGRMHTSYNPTRTTTGRLCVAPDTLIETNHGPVRIDQLEPTGQEWVLSHTGRQNRILKRIYKGVEPMVRLVLETGEETKCTEQHRVYTRDGWTPVADLSVGDKVIHHVSEQARPERPPNQGETNAPVSEPYQANDKGGRNVSRDYRPHSQRYNKRRAVSRAATARAGAALLSVEDGHQEPDDWQVRARPSPVQPRNLSWERRLYDNAQTSVVFRGQEPNQSYGSSYRNVRTARGEKAAPQNARSPHRRKHKKQLPRQPSPGDPQRSRLAPREVTITHIESLGAAQVWDLQIERDHSYLAHGLFHHNSSESPNAQNFPSRKNPWVKSQYIPDPGCLFAAMDFAQVEARVIAMASHDEVLCKSLEERYDIHMDWAEKLAYAYPKIVGGKKMISDPEVMKKWRSEVKNTWTFPLFFGCSAGSASRYTGIPDNIIYPLYDEFWETFGGVLEWQSRVLAQYTKQGYVESLSGRRRHAPMTKNEYINTSVQGDASDICINAMDRLSELAQEEGDWHYQANLNIHDDLTFVLPKKNLDYYLEPIVETMLFPEFEWVTVPLGVEAAIGKNLHEKESIGDFFSDEW